MLFDKRNNATNNNAQRAPQLHDSYQHQGHVFGVRLISSDGCACIGYCEMLQTLTVGAGMSCMKTFGLPTQSAYLPHLAVMFLDVYLPTFQPPQAQILISVRAPR